MKFFYIDDSYFRSSKFLSEMRKRLYHMFEKIQPDAIFISGMIGGLEAFEGFLKTCRKLQIQVVMSPASFDIQGVKGVLSHTALMLDEFPVVHPYSGSVVVFDIDAKTYERIYLDLFPKQPYGSFVEELTEEIERILTDYVKNPNKNPRYN